ncbi:hypothetical protein ACFQI3_01330 [Hansschlegelia quercus]|uniref:Uncharacterized protein n=1 Tax=Hansschlegelia quercus TaxID=2528245 RepID=A0A4V2JD85_9HYPH|nr:hypothetical protein [Hansschlegelia quercus]TBN47015.1 hypothetical protein EYR15_16540 [Hansschlegelia quercus]
MSKLSLAVEIADVVVGSKGPLDVQSAATELHKAFPEASVTQEEIAQTLTSESEAVGLPTVETTA